MSIDSIASYLAISKNEQGSIDKFVKSDSTTQQGVATLTKKAASLTTPEDLLSDQTSLGVLLSAFNISANINQTAVLKALMTQDPSSATSLANTSNNNNFKAFASFMTDVSTVVVGLPPAANLALTTGGSAASSVTVQNTAFSAPTTQTAQNVGQQFTFVLNDGSAVPSIEGALNAAAGRGASYTVNPDGSVTVSAGSPPVTETKDSVGDAIYTLALAADSDGNVTSQVSIVSVPVTSGETPDDRSSQVAALVASIQAAGFGAAQNADGSLAITGKSIDASASTSDGVTTVLPGAGAIATAAATTSDSVIAFGAAGAGLQPGQVLNDGSTILGTIKAVDSSGNITLTTPANGAVSVGDYLTVDPLSQTTVAQAATAATISNVGFQTIATAATTTSDNVLELGAAAAGLQPGQVVTDGATTIGTIAAVDGTGQVTLAQNSLAPIAIGDTLTVASVATATSTPALQNAGRVATAINEYETNQYEQAQDLANPGMHEALYFTRSIANVTSINQLMSDPTLLSVVTTSLGLPSTAFGSLDYDQQVRILTKDVDVAKFQDPNFVKQTAEQYLIYQQANAPTPVATGITALFGDTSDASQTMLGIIGGQSLTTTSTSGSSTLGLFA